MTGRLAVQSIYFQGRPPEFEVPNFSTRLCLLYMPANMNTSADSAARMVQMMSSLGISLDQLQDPERMSDLIEMASHMEHRASLPDDEEVRDQIDAARARWATESQRPAQKPRLTRRSDLELENREVERQMSQANTGISTTFIGQDKNFSTTLIARLRKGT